MKPYLLLILVLVCNFSVIGQGVFTKIEADKTRERILSGVPVVDQQLNKNEEPLPIPPEKINQIITDSENLFKEGLMNLQDNRRPQAREKFDKSIEVFLASTVNVPSNAKLKGCYDLLVETVYRIEFPTTKHQPQIKGLALTCGWNIDNGLADSVAKITQNAPKATTTASNLSDKEKGQIQAITGIKSTPQVGFAEQKFEPSTLDPLSAIQFSSKERKEFFQKYYSEVGRKPKQSADRTVPLVIDYFKENLNDPYSMKFVRWSDVALHGSCSNFRPCWLVSVKYRAKNEFGAYILTENTFEIKSEKIIYKFDGTLKPDFYVVDSRAEIPTPKLSTNFRPIRLVKAQNGDTIAKIAARFGVPAIEVAKFNGLSNAVNSPLPVGREIRIPSR